MPIYRETTDGMAGGDQDISPTYSLRYFAEGAPKYQIPQEGMPAAAAYQLVHDAFISTVSPLLTWPVSPLPGWNRKPTN